MMKNILFILVLLMCFTAEAQRLTYGVAGRFGAFNTFASHDGEGREPEYGTGLQAALGAWAKSPIATKVAVQATVMQLAERQSAGEVTLIDMNRNPYADAAITNKSLAVVLQSLLLYELTDKWSAGVGAGVKYEYLAKSTMEAALTYHPNNPNYYEEIKETKNTLYRRDVTLHLPVEVQYTLSDKLAAVTQLQFQVSNRTTQSSYKEHDVYLTVGINYSL